jgi:hypothetical protein
MCITHKQHQADQLVSDKYTRFQTLAALNAVEHS